MSEIDYREQVQQQLAARLADGSFRRDIEAMQSEPKFRMGAQALIYLHDKLKDDGVKQFAYWCVHPKSDFLWQKDRAHHLPTGPHDKPENYPFTEAADLLRAMEDFAELHDRGHFNKKAFAPKWKQALSKAFSSQRVALRQDQSDLAATPALSSVVTPDGNTMTYALPPKRMDAFNRSTINPHLKPYTDGDDVSKAAFRALGHLLAPEHQIQNFR